VEWLEKERGAEPLATLVRALPEEDQKAFAVGRPALGLLAATWYPAELVHRFLDQLTAGLGEGQQELMARRGAEAIMSANLRGVYKSIFGLVVSPRLYAFSIQQIWDMHYDSGTVRIVDVGRAGHRSTISGWRAHHPFACLLNQAATYPIYEAMGCREVVARREACQSQGAAACVFLVEWEP
jgi:hypothetical protein